jgi:hypothetical protein
MKIGAALLQRRLSRPDEFRSAVIDFFQSNGVKVTLDKTIAERILYDQQILNAAAGVTNFFTGAITANNSNMGDSYTPPEGQHFIILGIRLLNGVNAALNATAWTFGANVAANLQATYDFTSNGVKVLQAVPGTAHNPNLTTDDQGVLWLTEPVFWRAQTKIDLPFTTLTAPVANSNLRFELIGVGLVA